MKKVRIFVCILAALFFVGFGFAGVRSFFGEMGSFVFAFFSSPNSIGALFPSSPFLAKAITRQIKRRNDSLRILEVGAGTGAFTKKIAEKLKEDDVFDIIELDTDFCQRLQKKFKNYKNVHIHCLSILDWEPEQPYDFIISGLPFNAFKADFLRAIIEKYKKLIKEGGVISYFEYIALAKIKLFFLRGYEKKQYSKTLSASIDFRNEFEFEKNKVFANLPPAYVHHLQLV
jgi:phosphatidylethanolamine/phosphatidyl-N-methylethanolamine N-methyltransferase